jgi:hypothetical protein
MYLNNEFQELFRKANDLLGALLAQLDCDKMLDNKSDPERQYKAATIFFLIKAIKSYRAVHLLCSAGFFQDAAVLSRTIFEIFLQIAYMSGNPEDRAPLFIKHDLVGRYFLYLKLKKYPDLVNDIEKHRAELEKLTNQLRSWKTSTIKAKAGGERICDGSLKQWNRKIIEQKKVTFDCIRYIPTWFISACGWRQIKRTWCLSIRPREPRLVSIRRTQESGYGLLGP